MIIILGTFSYLAREGRTSGPAPGKKQLLSQSATFMTLRRAVDQDGYADRAKISLDVVFDYLAVLFDSSCRRGQTREGVRLE
jgi:hypothetical protein